MTQKYLLTPLLAGLTLLAAAPLAAQAQTTPTGSVGIGTTTPNASAALDVSSSTKGLLPPRMTQTGRDAIRPAATAAGLTIYNTSTNKLNVWNGTAWTEAVSAVDQFVGPASSVTFAYTGSMQTYTVPAGVTSLQVEARGAEGGASRGDRSGSYPGGWGARVQATLTVTPGQVLYLYVGGKGETAFYEGNTGGGFNGGGNGGYIGLGPNPPQGGGGGGGGASDIRTSASGDTYADRLLTAAGGGGGGGRGGGGGGGAPNGEDGRTDNVSPPGGAPGAGATQSSGNAIGKGGNHFPNEYAAGGGGGYWGGSFGSPDDLYFAYGGGGGGGGSSWVTPTGGSNVQLTASYNTGNGVIILTSPNSYAAPALDGRNFVNVPGDNLGNHTATRNLDLAEKLLVGNGGSTGLAIGSGGNVGIGTAATEKLQVAGTVYSSVGGFKFPDGTTQTTAAVTATGAGFIQNTTTQQAGSNFNISGSGTIGGNGTVTGNSTVGGTSTVTGNAYVNGGLGVMLNQQDRPLITRSWDAFGSGKYQGAGRWGLFMESEALTYGVPALANKRFQWVTYGESSGIASTLMTLNQAGQLGIGTTGPATTLDVRTTDENAAITVGRTDGVFGALYLGNANHGLKRNYATGNDVGLYTTSGTLYLSANGTSTAQFALLNGGNVGIGTNTPGEKLEVKDGSIRLSTTTQAIGVGLSNGSGSLNLGLAQGAGNYSDLARPGDAVLRTNGGNLLLAGREGGNVLITSGAGGSEAERLRVTSAGNVGIGTSDPQQKLDVNGSLRVRGLAGTGSRLPVVLADGTLGINAPVYTTSTPTATTPAAAGEASTGNFPNGVAVSGATAYVVNNESNTLQVFNVGTAGAPVAIGSVGTGAAPISVEVSGTVAYVANQGGSLQLFDVSNPYAPALLSSIATGNNTYDVALSGTRAYVVNNDSRTMQVFDVSNPRAPALLGAANTGNAPQTVAVSGTTVYVANVSSSNVQIFNASNPAAISLVGTIGTIQYPTGLAVSGTTVYVVGHNSTSTSVLQIFNAGNPGSPTQLGSIGTTMAASDMALSGTTAYVICETGNVLQLFNVSNPSAPTLLSTLGTNRPFGVAVSGTTAYVTDADNDRLRVFSAASTGRPVTVNPDGSFSSGTAPTLSVSGSSLSISGGNTVLLPLVAAGPGLSSSTSGSVTTLRLGPITAATDVPLGSNHLTFSGSGKIGIGTTGPTQALDVEGGIMARSQNPISRQGAYLQWNRSSGEGETWLLNQKGGGNEYAGVRFGKSDGLNNVTEWARFIDNGNLGLGTFTPDAKLDIESSAAQQLILTSTSNDPTGMLTLNFPATNSVSNTSTELLIFNKANVGTIGAIGANLGNNTVYYNTASDRRLKENIRPTHYGLSDLLKLRVQDYNFIGTAASNRTTGFLAQDLFRVYPEAVTPGDAGATVSRAWAVDYGKLTPLLVQAIQDQQKLIDQQQAEIQALKARAASAETKAAQATAATESFEQRLRALEAGVTQDRK
ncbi:tail fiber domain-containing protein [Hymenobacter sp. BT683]|uniref:receptor protein-tyrosine kinase n=1 Tax=Hymenobacter jeongseonensis TaxID=2791027 RepID=A0ABS0IF84_9BACT|nr:glycine-rich protein [Hymenobacter jeongseonensis]MBF9237021.1 tail fiber domain-containing protein [Hymenobacter jeongseonensis]